MKTRITLAGCLILLAFAPAGAQDYLIVFDARPTALAGDGTRDITQTPAAIAGFAWSKVGAFSDTGCVSLTTEVEKKPRLDLLGRALACSSRVVKDSLSREEFLAHSRMVRAATAAAIRILEANKSASTLRTTAGKGAELKVAVIQSGMQVARHADRLDTSADSATCPIALLARPVDVTINAKPRASQIAADMKALLQIALRTAGVSAGEKINIVDPRLCATEAATRATPVDLMSVYSFRVPITRATVEIEVNADAAPSIALAIARQPSGAVAPSAPEVPASQPVKPKATVLTGPEERWFLAGDIPLNGTKAESFSYNPENGSIDVAEKPASYHLSLNFMLLGDLLGDRRWYQSFFLKGLISASKKPLSSYGAGIGYRGPLFTDRFISLDAISPYAAYIWTRTDSSTASGIFRDKKTIREGRFGASVNLGKVLGWVK